MTTTFYEGRVITLMSYAGPTNAEGEHEDFDSVSRMRVQVTLPTGWVGLSVKEALEVGRSLTTWANLQITAAREG